MKKGLCLLVTWLLSMSGYAQNVNIEFMTPSIVHVVRGKPTKTLVVTAKPQDVKVVKKGLTTSSSELTVRQDAQGNLTFLTVKGKVLLREKACGIAEARQTFTLDKDEAIYGLGTIQNGKMNRRGEKKRMEQSNLEDFQNVLQSIKGWGIYWENYSPTLFEDNANGMTFDSEAGEGIDYYFMYGGSADGVIAQMRHLTGEVPMFPMWTYGFWQSKERYKRCFAGSIGWYHPRLAVLGKQLSVECDGFPFRGFCQWTADDQECPCKACSFHDKYLGKFWTSDPAVS